MRFLWWGRGAVRMTRMEMIFGTLRKGGVWVSDEEWEGFVQSDIAVHFSDGFTILPGEGRWRHSSGKFVPDKCKILIVWDRSPKRLNAKGHRIRDVYKARFGLESVLSSLSVAIVSF